MPLRDCSSSAAKASTTEEGKHAQMWRRRPHRRRPGVRGVRPHCEHWTPQNRSYNDSRSTQHGLLSRTRGPQLWRGTHNVYLWINGARQARCLHIARQTQRGRAVNQSLQAILETMLTADRAAGWSGLPRLALFGQKSRPARCSKNGVPPAPLFLTYGVTLSHRHVGEHG